MFQKKRKLKKEKIRERLKILLILVLCLVIVTLVFEYLYFNLSLGRITYVSPVAKNNTSEIAFLESLLEKSNIQFTTVSASSGAYFVVELKDRGVVFLSSKKDIKSQISSLQLILSRLTIEGKKLKTLDFRYDNAIVSF